MNAAEYMRQTVVYGLALCVVLTATVFSLSTEDTGIIKTVIGQVMVAGMTCLWFARLLLAGNIRFRFMPAALPLLCLLLGCVASLVFSPTAPSLAATAYYATGILFIWLVYEHVRTRRELLLLIGALLAAAVYNIVYALLQHTGYDVIEWGMPVMLAGLCCPCQLVLFIASVLPLMLAMLLACRHWLLRVLLCLCSIGAAWCIYEISNPDVNTALLLALFVFVALQALTGAARTGYKNALVAAAAGAVLLIASTSGLISRHTSEFATTVRQVIWSGTARMWADSPVFGQGIGMFATHFPRFRTPQYHRLGVSHTMQSPGSEYATIAAEQGMVGLVLAVWCIGAVLHLGLRALHNERNGFRRHLLIGLLSSAALLATMAFDLPHGRRPPMEIVAGTVIGLVLILAGGAREEEETTTATPVKARQYLAMASLAGIFVVVGLLEWRMFSAHMLAKRGEALLQNAGGAVTEDNRPVWLEAHTMLTAALTDNRNDPGAWYKRAYINLQLGRVEEAADNYRQLMRVAPHYAQVHYNAGLTAYLRGDTLAATEQFLLAARLEDNPHNRQLCGALLLERGDRRSAEQYRRYAALALEDWMQSLSRRAQRAGERSPGVNDADIRRSEELRSAFVQSFAGAAQAAALYGDMRRSGYYRSRAEAWAVSATSEIAQHTAGQMLSRVGS